MSLNGSGAAKGFGRRNLTSIAAASASQNARALREPAPAPPRPTLRPAESYIENPAVQSVLMEFEQCATVICVILSVINRPNPTTVVTFSLREYQQPNPTMFPSLRHLLSEYGAPRELISALEAFHATFKAALPAITEITNDMPNGFDRNWINAAHAILIEAAEDAQAIVELVGAPPAVSAIRTDLRLAPAKELYPLVREVLEGKAPCWLYDRPALPSWHMKRGAVRRTLNAAAELHFNSLREKVIVTDISRHGFGVSRASRVEVGAQISVILDTGRTLTGKVCWVKLDKIGVELSQPLAMNDPLIAAT